jgi:catechol 2,3-dioxygenase-like lactoylglutathione lyase family enzyme
MKLRQARIATHDVARLTRFYRDLTGLSPTGSDLYVEFHAPTLAIAITSQDVMERHGAGATTPNANRSVVLDFEVAEVDAERERIRELVPELVLAPTDQPWGNRSMLFRDPDGNLINFFSLPTAGHGG